MYVRLFFSDFSKGFVDHNVLLRELDNLDVDPHVVRWIAAFLTNRNQRVRVGEALSPPIWLNGRTPQGTQLAPLLFCILVNRMASNCTNRVKYGHGICSQALFFIFEFYCFGYLLVCFL